MGTFDMIIVYMRCPYCKRMESFDAQTKDLGSSMFTYHTIPKDWFTNEMERKMRKTLPVFSQFPLDKEAKVWKNQAERKEAQATIPEEYLKKKFVNVIADCHSPECQAWADERDRRFQGIASGFGRMFKGRIIVKNGLLIGEIYNIIHSDKRLPPKKKEKLKKK